MGLFGLYWSSATISFLGDGVRLVAVPLLAASLSSSVAEVALVAAAMGLPWLMFGLFAGVLVDRSERARLMVLLQAVRGAIGVALVVGAATETLTIPSLVVLVFLLGTCEVIYDLAFHALLPMLVERQDLPRANGRLVTAETVALELLGPVLGGTMFAAATALPFALDTLCFAASAALLVLVARRVAPAPPGNRISQSVVGQISLGLRWFKGHVLVRNLTMLAVAANLAVGGFEALFVLLSRDELSLGPTGYGLLIAIGAAGSIAAGIAAERVTSNRWRRLVCLLATPVVIICFATLTFTRSFVVAAALLTVIGFAVSSFNIVAMSLRQALTPNDMLGRVTAVHRMLCWGALPVGAGIAGVVGEAFGVRTAIGACAAVAAILALLALVSSLATRSSDYAVA